MSLLISIKGLIAQPNYVAPTGIWCSCPPTTGVGNGSVVPNVAAKSYVNGILVRVAWKDLETTDNVYNWSLIDNQLTAARSYGKKVSLAIGGGLNAPNWLYTLGVQSISYTIPFNGTIPIPWDTVFLKKWGEFINELGNRYANDTTIRLVYMTNSSTNGFEMQLPFNPTPSYQTIGYTDQKIIDSWEYVIDQFKSAFPNHYLTNDYHPVNSSNLVADSIYAYATSTIGSRYGANGWWWTQNNTTVYPSQYAILQHSATANMFTGIQMAYSGTSNPDMFGTGGMPAALSLAISDKICYWEIWNEDITNSAFDSILSAAACTPTLGLEETTTLGNPLSVFPNPSSGSFSILLKNGSIESVEVMNMLGQIVFQQSLINNNIYELDLESNTGNVFMLKVTDHQKVVSYTRIILKK